MVTGNNRFTQQVTPQQMAVIEAMQHLIDQGRKVTAVSVSQVRKVSSGNGDALKSLLAAGLVDSSPERGWFFTEDGKEFVSKHLTNRDS